MNRRSTGARFEAMAAEFLESKAFTILNRNFRFGRHEIDLICADGDCVVFVEVKGVRSEAFGDPIHKVDQRKRDSIIAAAQGYLQQSLKRWDNCRFDVVTVVQRPDGTCDIDHRPNAFTL